MSNERITTAAARLTNARKEGARIDLGSDTPRDWDEGFAVQAKVVEALGSPVIGWKVIEVPDGPVIHAPLLESGVTKADTQWDVVGKEPAGIELEIAFRMRRDVPAGTTAAEVLDCVDTGLVVFELCQSRLADPAKQPRHVALADCISNTGIVVGPEIPGWKTAELKGRPGRLFVDGKVHVEGRSVDPIRALQVLAPALTAHGKSLKAGQIVITGSLIGMNWLTGAHALKGEIEGFGSVSLSLKAA
jgi:2-keto-4-pentenoate hydratase